MEGGELAAFPLNKPVVSDRSLAARFLASFHRRGVGYEVLLRLGLQIWWCGPSIWSCGRRI